MAKFIERHLFTRYGIPHHIVSDNGVQFQGETATLIEKYGIEHHRSSPYRPQANGAVEAANKSIKRILAKTVVNYRDWADKLPFAVWGYRTSVRTPTGKTPYSLVYGMEAVLPVEMEVKSLRVALESQLNESEWARQRYEQLNMVDEQRLKALDQLQMYQRRMARAYNKKVKKFTQPLKAGDLVLKQIRATHTDPRGKFRPN